MEMINVCADEFYGLKDQNEYLANRNEQLERELDDASLKIARLSDANSQLKSEVERLRTIVIRSRYQHVDALPEYDRDDRY